MRSWPFFLLLITILLKSFGLKGQDQIFLRHNNEVVYCFIIHANDSLIVFRSAEPADTTTYEIQFTDTYGFLLEKPAEMTKGAKTAGMQMRLYHPDKKRNHTYRENSHFIFSLLNDSLRYPRQGKITRISHDSIEVETSVRHKKDRLMFALNDFEEFGYTTGFTEILSLIVFPFPWDKNPGDFFYRHMPPAKGWQLQVLSDSPRKIKKRVKWKRIRPGGAVKRRIQGNN
ncbi:MAG: hypothetical protein IT240_09635 [Bacteroidia bacterium]|nr:hypothetical protein [Bacteroidia bacterium]